MQAQAAGVPYQGLPMWNGVFWIEYGMLIAVILL